MGQGPFSPLTGGLDLTPSACAEHNAYIKYLDKVYLMTDYLKFQNADRLWTCLTKAGGAWQTTIYRSVPIYLSSTCQDVRDVFRVFLANLIPCSTKVAFCDPVTKIGGSCRNDHFLIPQPGSWLVSSPLQFQLFYIRLKDLKTFFDLVTLTFDH